MAQETATLDAAAQPVAAEGTASVAVEGKAKAQPDSLSSILMNPLFFVVIAIWLWVFWSARKHKQKEEERKNQLDNLKKGDKVLTIGRMFGTVVELDAETMTLKTDNKSNATVKFERGALYKNLSREAEKKKEEAEASS